MMISNAQSLKDTLAKLPGVQSVDDIKIKNKTIEYISFNNESFGRLMFQRLKVTDSTALFDFYFQGLSEKSRNLFPPYPLFSPPPNSVEELYSRIAGWGKDADWTFLNLTKDERIIGVCLLKRYQPEHPVSGLAVREEFQEMGLGFILQTIINGQARLLNLKRLYATVAPDNVASLQVHKKCGFEETGRLVPRYRYKDGIQVVDGYDVELVRA